MIFINRTRVTPPGPLADPDGAGARELKRAKAHYARKKNTAFEFKAYKDDNVREALAKLFGRKCAYCESVYTAVSPVDVEHFRPKGAIITADGKQIPRGYFWLAADWENLLPSCADCNRERKQVTLPTGEVRKSGKAEHFPLADEKKRATRPAQLAGEDPLLLNPCVDRPEQHLEFFDKDGQKALLRPRAASRKGERSIDVYGLNRKGLVEERQYFVAQTELALANLRVFVTAIEDGTAPAAAAMFQAQFDATLADLQQRRSILSRYCALARRLIDPELAALGLPIPPD